MKSDAHPPIDMALDDIAPVWREVCRRAARTAAEAEARATGGVPDDDEIPFNYRWEHVQHVVGLGCWLAQETGADLTVVEAAAWLHDVCKAEPDHAARGADAARDILEATDFPADKVDAVADAIFQHEGLTRTDTSPLSPLEAAVLWDADKLSKIGVQALAYTLSTGRASGHSLAERRARSQAFLDDVLTQTVASMNTDPARALATQRLDQNRLVLTLWATDEALVLKHLPWIDRARPSGLDRDAPD